MTSISFQLLFAQSHWLTTIADWCGIVGLAVGIVSLLLTLLTFWKVQNVKETIETEWQKWILQNRLPEYYDQIVNAKEFFSNVFEANSNDTTDTNQVLTKTINQLAIIIKCCEQIEKYDQFHLLKLSDIEELKNKAKIILSHFSEHSPNNLKILKSELWSLLSKLETVIQNIKEDITIQWNFHK
ncbi:MAG: hypothetical protein LBK82_11215 [Planctomycetaceae bacterium]|jgi:hypothetical protein|nr:hypothetical protein [Planctomycetaceae bacterium]